MGGTVCPGFGNADLKLYLAPAGRRGFGLQAEVFFFFEPLARYTAAWRPQPHERASGGRPGFV